MSEELIKVGKVNLTKYEISQAYSHIYEQNGPRAAVWSKERLHELISEYWISKGKKPADE